MPVTLSTILYWIAIIFLLLTLYLIVIRIIRHFIHFPIPSFVTPLIDNPIRRKIQPPTKIINWINIQPSMIVLEIGPGPGTFTIEAARRLSDGTIFAIDIQPAVISGLTKILRTKKIKTIATAAASAYHLPFPDKTFDRVFMIAVLAEIPDKQRALCEINRVLKDDGLLAIGEFLPDPDYPRKKTVITWCKTAEFHLVTTHTNILHYLLTFKKSL